MIPEAGLFGTAYALGWLGSARMQAGRFAEAEEPLRECVAVHRELGVWGYGFQWTFLLARVCLHQGRYDEARALAERMVAEARDLDDARGTILGLALLGEGALAAGAFAEADRCLTESAEAAGRYTEDRYKHGQGATLGLAARGLGRPVEAEQQLRSVLRQKSGVQRFPVQMVALVGLSLLYADEGEAERAVELFSLASRYGFVANSIWFQDIVGQTLTEAAAGLSPDVLHAARERGAALDLEDTIGELLAGRSS
jgi:tetratricopeptide (TPR) repeat protein